MKLSGRVLLAVVAGTSLAFAAYAAPQSNYSIPRAHEEVVLKSGATMIYDQNVAVTLRDGHVVYANVFRPKQAGTYPVIMAQGPYGKDATFQEAYASGWTQLLKANPNICAQSSCRFMRWEHTDPERWVGGGYVVIALDVRGAGYSPGYLDLVSAREARDFYDAIEWAAAQPWSNGKVGLLGISYMAINQWQVAALQSPHLAAIIPWEGASDLYREALFHGGIESNVFLQLWFKSQILPNQNGNAATAYKDPGTGRPPTGAALSDDLLKANRRNLIDSAHAHPLLDGYNQEINADLSRIRTPLLSAGNLSAPSLHGRGNYEGFVQASSTEKWLFLHTGTHDDSFYSDEGIALQHKFFDHYLKGIDNKWEKTARVSLVERDPARATWTTRSEEGWPLARTRYVNYHLDAQNRSLGTEVPKGEASVTFDAGKTAATFDMVFDRTMEFTGPLAAHLWVASSTADADLFVTLQLFDEKGREVTFLGASDTASPLAQGWLRASRRKLDVQRSKPYQPWHTHDEVQKLKPDEFYPVDVEIWPTSIVVHPGYKLTLRIEGADFQRPPSNPDGKSIGRRGSGVFLHDDPADRPNPEFSGVTTIASGGARDSFLVLPTIPRGE
ncbi:CocE/NonD family hydrolase [Bradyrhizobium sp. Leo170]|uniref:CocE/NonD family hydrolase n=1 Tax=Bradyrhizobium sp. Leo170 TaxID=1571199 RepID=UPI001FDF76F7|nr:CocE/NonD family hydrolase [Bradyrhizobium sp. Leo170]